MIGQTKPEKITVWKKSLSGKRCSIEHRQAVYSLLVEPYVLIYETELKNNLKIHDDALRYSYKDHERV